MGEWNYIRMTGKKGDSGAELMILYSSQNAVNPNQDPDRHYWHQSFQSGDFYMCTKSADSSLWGNIMKIVGEGLTVQYSANGTSDWHSAPVLSTDKYMRQKMDSDSSWGAVQKIVGEDGADGQDGTNTWNSTASATTSTTSIAVSSIVNVPTGYSVKIGDLVIASGLLFYISAVGSTNLTVQYKQTIKGADGENAVVITALPATPAGTFTGQVGNYNGTLYQWDGTAWAILDIVNATTLATAKSEAIASANANVATYTPRYIGAYPSAPTVSNYNKGDWYCNTTSKGIFVSNGSSWGSAISYNENNKHYFEACANDVLQNADMTASSSSFTQFTTAFIQNLFAKNIVIATGGSIQSSNYSAGSSGFKISYQGDTEFNNITARGNINTYNIQNFSSEGYADIPTGTRFDDMFHGVEMQYGWYNDGTYDYYGYYGNAKKNVDGIINNTSFRTIAYYCGQYKKWQDDTYLGVVTEKYVSFLEYPNSENAVYEFFAEEFTDTGETEVELCQLEVVSDRIVKMKTNKTLHFTEIPTEPQETPNTIWADGGVLRVGSYSPVLNNFFTKYPLVVANVSLGKVERQYNLTDSSGSWYCFPDDGLVRDVLISGRMYDSDSIGIIVSSDVLEGVDEIAYDTWEGHAEHHWGVITAFTNGINFLNVSNSGRQANNACYIPVKKYLFIKQTSAGAETLSIKIHGWKMH